MKKKKRKISGKRKVGKLDQRLLDFFGDPAQTQKDGIDFSTTAASQVIEQKNYGPLFVNLLAEYIFPFLGDFATLYKLYRLCKYFKALVTEFHVVLEPFRFRAPDTVDLFFPVIKDWNLTSVELWRSKQRDIFFKILLTGVGRGPFNPNRITKFILDRPFEFTNEYANMESFEIAEMVVIKSIKKLSNLEKLVLDFNSNFQETAFIFQESLKSLKRLKNVTLYCEGLIIERGDFDFLENVENLEWISLWGFTYDVGFNFELFSRMSTKCLKLCEPNKQKYGNEIDNFQNNNAFNHILHYLQRNEIINEVILKNVGNSASWASNLSCLIEKGALESLVLSGIVFEEKEKKLVWKVLSGNNRIKQVSFQRMEMSIDGFVDLSDSVSSVERDKIVIADIKVLKTKKENSGKMFVAACTKLLDCSLQCHLTFIVRYYPPKKRYPMNIIHVSTLAHIVKDLKKEMKKKKWKLKLRECRDSSNRSQLRKFSVCRSPLPCQRKCKCLRSLDIEKNGIRQCSYFLNKKNMY